MAFFLFSNLKALAAPGRACVFLAVRAGEWGTCTESSSAFGLPGRCCIVVLLVAVAPDRPRAPVEKCPRPIEIALHDCGHHVYVVVVLYFLRFVFIREEGGQAGEAGGVVAMRRCCCNVQRAWALPPDRMHFALSFCRKDGRLC